MSNSHRVILVHERQTRPILLKYFVVNGYFRVFFFFFLTYYNSKFNEWFVCAPFFFHTGTGFEKYYLK